MKLQTFLFQMVVTSCISVQYLRKYCFANSSDNLYSPCITATACCNAADQLLLLVLIFKDIYKKQEFDDGLPPGSDVNMNRTCCTLARNYSSSDSQSIFSNTNFREGDSTFTSPQSSLQLPLLLQIAVENNVTVIRQRSHFAYTLQPIDKYFFWAFK
jgi:hypothetical protein